MLTPQEVQEKTFAKAVFGGYDMQTVDEFLEQVTTDYSDLYKENAALKNKLRVLVKTLETYKEKVDSFEAAGADAQKAQEDLLRETREKCDQMLREAQQKSSEGLIREEQKRLELAQKAAQNYIEVLERDIQGHLDLIASLKTRSMAEELELERKPYDYDKHEPSREAEIAGAIDKSLSEMGLTDEAPAEEPTPSHPESTTIRFENLQFGKNYDPKNPAD